MPHTGTPEAYDRAVLTASAIELLVAYTELALTDTLSGKPTPPSFSTPGWRADVTTSDKVPYRVVSNVMVN